MTYSHMTKTKTCTTLSDLSIIILDPVLVGLILAVLYGYQRLSLVMLKGWSQSLTLRLFRYNLLTVVMVIVVMVI